MSTSGSMRLPGGGTGSQPSVVLATSAPGRREDDEIDMLAEAVRRRVGPVAVWGWDDPARDWSAPTLVVVRSVWDYVERRDEFLAWVESVAAQTAVANPVPLLRWNTDKAYLRDLAGAGVAVVTTRYLAPGQALPTSDELDASWPGSPELVVKPTVSAGARLTGRFADAAAALDHVQLLHAAGQVAMVQPYVASVDQRGEIALVYLGGRFSHAVRKAALLARDQGAASDPRPGELSPAETSPEHLEVAHAALGAVAGDWLYARVDLIDGPDGPAVLELELTEPSLFVTAAADPWAAAERFAAAVQSWLARPRDPIRAG